MADDEDRGWMDAAPADKEGEAEAVAKKDGGYEASEGGAERSSKRSKRSRSRSKEGSSSRRREKKDRDGGADGKDDELGESTTSSRRDKDRDKERKRSRRSRSRSRSRDRSHRGSSRRDRSRSRSRERSRRDDSRSSRRRDRSEERDERTAEQREIDELTKDQRTVFVSQLVMKADERALKKFFTQFGKVRSVVMLRDKATNRHKGFAYVEMADLEAIPAVLLMNEQVPDFQKFPVKVAASQAEKNYLAKQEAMSKGRNPSGPTRRADRGLPRQVYLGNLHPNITEEDLMELLRPFGTVTKLVMARNEDGSSRGFAFATFEKVEEAQTVMTQLGGVPLADRPIKVGPVNEKADHSGKNAAAFAGAGGAGPAGAPPGAASGNWRLDDSSAQGLPLDAHSRVALMAKLGAGAGLQVPVPPPPPPGVVGGVAALSLGNATIPLPVQGAPGRCLLIKNLFDPFAPGQEDGWDLDIKEDVEDECGRYGSVKHVLVDVKAPGGLVYVLFGEEPAATKAAQALNGRWFAGRMVSVEYLTEAAFAERCPDAPMDG